MRALENGRRSERGNVVIDARSPSVGADGTIYASTDKGVYRVHDNGTSATVEPGWPFTGVSGAVDTAAATSGGKIYVSSFGPGTTRTVYAIDATGHELWAKTGPGTGSTSFALTPAPVIGSNGLVYAAIGRDVYAFDPASPDPASAPRWHYMLGDDAISLSIGDGVLYVSAKDSTVYALVS